MSFSSDSDDELLNYAPFRKKSESCPTAASDTDQTLQKTPKKLHSESKKETIETAAQCKASRAYVPFEDISHPSMLFWYKMTTRSGYKRKAKVTYFPCRECHPDEAIGLALPEQWDNKVKALVQFIGDLKFDDRSIVRRKLLLPYCGEIKVVERKLDKTNVVSDTGCDGGNESLLKPWCPSIMGEFLAEYKKKQANDLGQRKPMGKNDQQCHEGIDLDINARAMKIYLDKILNAAFGNKDAQTKSYEIKHGEKDKVFTGSSQAISLGENLSGSDLLNSCPTLSHSHSDTMSNYSSTDEQLDISENLRKKEYIRPGDVIEYYNPIGVSGDRRFYRRTKVIHIEARNSYPLGLENGEFLPNTVHIKRIEIIRNGKMYDNSRKGSWMQIQDYKLKTAKIQHNARSQDALLEQSRGIGLDTPFDMLAFERKRKR